MPDPTLPSPTQHPTGQAVDLDEVRARLRVYEQMCDELDLHTVEWRMLWPTSASVAADVPALLADLDAAREALRRAQDVLDAAVAYVAEPDGSDLVEQYWHELDVATRQYLAAAVDTYETQEGTE